MCLSVSLLNGKREAEAEAGLLLLPPHSPLRSLVHSRSGIEGGSDPEYLSEPSLEELSLEKRCGESGSPTGK